MSRDILFKAKRKDGEWVEGYYAVIGNRNVIIKKKPEDYYSVDENLKKSYGNEVVEVSPETVCQWTGLNDENGQKIWENDIVLIHSNSIDDEDGYFTVEWDDECAMFELKGDGLITDFDSFDGFQCEVVGNIFDNPELLEGKEE